MTTAQLRAALLALCLTGPLSAQTWSEPFEAYAPGSALEGQGGWTGWDGVQTANTVVTTTHARSGTRSIQPNPGADSVYQFNAPTSGTWVFEGHVYIPTGFASQLDYMVMYAYQHFGPYEWGSWIVFNGAAGTVTCNCGGFGSNVVGMPYDRWVEIRQVIDLDTDQATIFFDGAQFAQYTWSSGYSGSAGHATPSIAALDLYATTTGSGLFIDDLRLYSLASGIGTAYCAPAAVNSTGNPALISATGFTQVATNDVTLTASALPNNAFGFFLASRTQGFVQNPGGSSGNLCLGGAIGRYVGPGQIKNSGTTGSYALRINLAQMPQPTGPVAAIAGQTWSFQSWYRDAIGGVATSNFTHGVAVTLQ